MFGVFRYLLWSPTTATVLAEVHIRNTSCFASHFGKVIWTNFLFSSKSSSSDRWLCVSKYSIDFLNKIQSTRVCSCYALMWLRNLSTFQLIQHWVAAFTHRSANAELWPGPQIWLMCGTFHLHPVPCGFIAMWSTISFIGWLIFFSIHFYLILIT